MSVELVGDSTFKTVVSLICLVILVVLCEIGAIVDKKKEEESKRIFH